jgi:hypothetical protein
VRGGAREVHGIKAVMMRERERRKRRRRGGVHGAELSGELGRGSGERFPWTVALPRRARDARGGDGARSEIGESAVSGSGRNGQLRRERGRWRKRARARALLLLARWEETRGSRGGRCACGGCRRARRGARATGRPGAAVAGAWRPRGSDTLPRSGSGRAARGRGERVREAG